MFRSWLAFAFSFQAGSSACRLIQTSGAMHSHERKNNELGLNPDSDYRNSAPSPRKPESPQQTINSTESGHGVMWFRCCAFCALGAGVDFVAQQRVGKIKFWSWDCISARVQTQFPRIYTFPPVFHPRRGLWTSLVLILCRRVPFRSTTRQIESHSNSKRNAYRSTNHSHSGKRILGLTCSQEHEASVGGGKGRV